jgi:hypothetical protein
MQRQRNFQSTLDRHAEIQRSFLSVLPRAIADSRFRSRLCSDPHRAMRLAECRKNTSIVVRRESDRELILVIPAFAVLARDAVLAAALTDLRVRDRLVASPRDSLWRHHRIRIDPQICIEVICDTPATMHLVIPFAGQFHTAGSLRESPWPIRAGEGPPGPGPDPFPRPDPIPFPGTIGTPTCISGCLTTRPCTTTVKGGTCF